MTKILSFLSVTALSGALLVCGPASAQVVRYDAGLKPLSPFVTEVQFHGGRGRGGPRFHGGHRFGRHGFGGHRFGGRPGFGGGHHWGGRYGGYRHGWRGGRGAAIGAGVAGLATGALIGGALASQAPAYGYGYAPAPVLAPPADGGAASCAQRFRSYDPASGTYLGYDGQRHACP